MEVTGKVKFLVFVLRKWKEDKRLQSMKGVVPPDDFFEKQRQEVIEFKASQAANKKTGMPCVDTNYLSIYPAKGEQSMWEIFEELDQQEEKAKAFTDKVGFPAIKLDSTVDLTAPVENSELQVTPDRSVSLMLADIKLLSETSLLRFKLALNKRLSWKTWKRSQVKWLVAAFAGNLLLSSFVLSKISRRLPVTSTRLRAALNWLIARALRGGTALSHVLLGLVVSVLIRIPSVVPSSLVMHTNNMIVRRQPGIKNSAILVDGGATDFMTNSLQGLIGYLARVNGESFITAAGPKAFENSGLFRLGV